MFVKDELAAYTMKHDGTDGYHMVFAAQDYAASEHSNCSDGAVVHLID